HRFDGSTPSLLQADELEQLDPLALTAERTGQALVQLEQLVGGHPAGKTEELRKISQRCPRLPRAGPSPADFRASFRRPDKSACDLDERGFSGAVRPEQTDELAVSDLEIHAAECLDSPVTLDETADGERCGHGAERTLTVMPRGYEEGP